MAIILSEKNHDELDKFIGTILDLYAGGEVSKVNATEVLANVFTWAAVDNETEVISWISNPEILSNWKSRCDAKRT